VDDTLDVGELTYEDPDRADVAEWLDAHGWRPAAVTSQDEMRRLGRAIELTDTDDDSFLHVRHRRKALKGAGYRPCPAGTCDGGLIYTLT
jgi:O-methyltransferase involved in polyketide biosynthesis